MDCCVLITRRGRWRRRRRRTASGREESCWRAATFSRRRQSQIQRLFTGSVAVGSGFIAVARAEAPASACSSAACSAFSFQFGQRFAVRRAAQQARRLFLRVHERGPVDQRLGRVPHHIGDGFFRIDAQQVLQDAQERDLLRRVDHLPQDRVEHVQVRAQIHSIGSFAKRFIQVSFSKFKLPISIAVSLY